MIIFILIILIYSAILHEIAHGWVAERLGDPTARISGRLTLDPRPHIDPLLTIALPAILILAGSPVIFGGAKPVPIDPFNFQRPKRDLTLVSAAGPLTNFFLAALSALTAKMFELFFLPNSFLIQSVVYGVFINLSLGIFNLLPIPPLDGFKVVGGLLPDSFADRWYGLERFGLLFLIVFLFVFNGFVSSIISPTTTAVVHYLLIKPAI